MKVLVVKLTSLGDVVHTFPALTDAKASLPDLSLDFAVDEAFAPVARLHPAIRRVLSLPQRRLARGLLKHPLATLRSDEMRKARADLAAEPYDIVIDAQGLVKSALVARLASGERHGFSRRTAREGVAAFFYHRGHDVPEVEHMAVRLRRLFAAALGYELAGLAADTGLRPAPAPPDGRPLVFLHGTTWPTKTWTLAGWRALAARAAEAGRPVLLFAHGKTEQARAAAIASGFGHVRLMPAGGLETVVPHLAGAAGVVSVDTGLGHLAAAFGVPTVGLYGPTDPRLTGLFGARVRELAATRSCAPCEAARCRIAPEALEGPPCLADHAADAVWTALAALGAESAPEAAKAQQD